MPRGSLSSKSLFRSYLQKYREQRAKERVEKSEKRLGKGAAGTERAERKPAPPPAEAGPGSGVPGDEKKKKRSRSFLVLFKEYWRLLHGYRATVIWSLLTLTVATGLGLLQPAATKLAFDYILLDNPGPTGLPAWVRGLAGVELDAGAGGGATSRARVRLLVTLGAGLVAVTVLHVLFGMWGRVQVTRITKRLQVRLRRLVFDHAVRLPLHRVYQLKSGGVSSILREDAGGAGDLSFSLIYNPWRAVIQLVGTLVILGITDWRMLLGGLALIPAVWLSHRTWISRIRPVFMDIRKNRSQIDAHATEAFGGMRVVRGFGRERGEAGRFVRSSHVMARQEMMVWWWSRIIEIAWAMLVPTASAAVLVYGGWQVVKGNLTLGDVMMFSAYLFMLLSPLDVLVSTATTIQNNLAGFDRVLDLMQEPLELGLSAGPQRHLPVDGAVAPSGLAVLSHGRVAGRVTLRDVVFSYPGHESRVIDGVSLDVAPGQMIALVGPSGSGKTTLCNLVARFFDPTSGVIELDGVSLKQIDVNSYRRLLGVVEQDVFLFDGTVEENIAYADPEASHERVLAAASAANADGFIAKLEKGYDTLIGERGVRLSGGQKQRLAIARALLADPRILILDEATSNLDSESESLIQRSLRVLMNGRTSFVIAHRLSTIRHADLIVVLESGRIIERGTHEQLIEQEGRYWEMLMHQVHAHTEPLGGRGPGGVDGKPAGAGRALPEEIF
ncbi:MAG: ABC transporter ATP-binding protein [Phycisphaerales bacterium]|nr:ABC transporter ATP-binding protein [Phycisphaerales bacterium]